MSPFRPSAMNTSEKPLSGLSWLGQPGPAVRLPAATVLVLTVLALSACTTSPTASRGTRPSSAADVALVRFNSCGDALQNLRAEAMSAFSANSSRTGSATAGSSQATATTPGAGASASAGGGLEAGSSAPNADRATQGNAAAGGFGQIGAATPGSYSGTNTATLGVDEPDLVKTDGRRIVTISGGALRVVDAQTEQLTGVLDLSSGSQMGGWTPASLLLAGNHALVLFSPTLYPIGGPVASPGGIGSAAVSSAGPVQSQGSASPGSAMPIEGPRMVLVDLSTGMPRIISQYTMDGSLVDARKVGSVARVVVQSAPRFYPLTYGQATQSDPVGFKAAVMRAAISQWLPRYSVTTGVVTHTGLVDCASLSHPAGAPYTGTSMLTVLTFDLSASSLGDGEPVTVVADGDAVYSDGTSLYIASREWVTQPAMGTTGEGGSDAGPADVMPVASQGYTGIYKFDISGPQPASVRSFGHGPRLAARAVRHGPVLAVGMERRPTGCDDNVRHLRDRLRVRVCVRGVCPGAVRRSDGHRR